MAKSTARAASGILATLGLCSSIVACVAIAGAGCGVATAAASRDPMKCERDPACAKSKGAYPDCALQCADDPECIDRCRQVQAGTDALGHP